MSSTVFHVVIILLLVSVNVLVVFALLKAKSKAQELDQKINDALNLVHTDIVPKVDDMYAKVTQMTALTALLEKICGKDLPIIGRLC